MSKEYSPDMSNGIDQLVDRFFRSIDEARATEAEQVSVATKTDNIAEKDTGQTFIRDDSDSPVSSQKNSSRQISSPQSTSSRFFYSANCFENISRQNVQNSSWHIQIIQRS